MKKQTNRVYTVIDEVSKVTGIRAIRSGLISITPVLIMGAFSLVLKTLPWPAYQDAISRFLNGFILDVLSLVYNVTFGMLSLYMTLAISRAYKNELDYRHISSASVSITSAMCFLTLTGITNDGITLSALGPKAMFMAILSGIFPTALYIKINRRLTGKKALMLTEGASKEFNSMLNTIAPLVFTTLIFAIVSKVITTTLKVDSLRELIVTPFIHMFQSGKRGFIKGFMYVLTTSTLWFFGIHGSDILEEVTQGVFVPGLEENIAAAAAGMQPASVLTKEFFDCFVLIGGCGTTICLLIAILVFSKSKAKKDLSTSSALPMLFNINELMVFGLPIIYNPSMLIPFILTPLTCYTVAYAAIATGAVPMITHAVEWTTPVLIGGYTATGSIAGAFLQLVNMALGVLIYMPFVKAIDRQEAEFAEATYQRFLDFFKQNEPIISTTDLLTMENSIGDFAKKLCAELKSSYADHIAIAYQPQYDYSGTCIGAEALLRWNHPVYGMLYPPLVFKLAEEGGYLEKLEQVVVQKVIADRDASYAKFGENTVISFNVTGTTVVSDEFAEFFTDLNATYNLKNMHLCLEITEQAAISFTDKTKAALKKIRGMGVKLAIDDFSMGQTSLHYLKNSLFDIIKLDGSLVAGIVTQKPYRDIAASIISLATTLQMETLAEYVETEEQRDILHKMGCNHYQGYLYSPAVSLDAE